MRNGGGPGAVPFVPFVALGRDWPSLRITCPVSRKEGMSLMSRLVVRTNVPNVPFSYKEGMSQMSR